VTTRQPRSTSADDPGNQAPERSNVILGSHISERDHVFRANSLRVLICLYCIIYGIWTYNVRFSRLPYVCYHEYLRALTHTQNRKTLASSAEGGDEGRFLPVGFEMNQLGPERDPHSIRRHR
jgi:hypothetical protein